MRIINFGHPLNGGVLQDLVQVTDAVIGEVKDVKCQVDNDQPFEDQARGLVDSVGWTSEEWQTRPFMLVPPGLAPLALCVVAEIHGRCGYFPSVVRLKPLKGQVPPQFVFGEIIVLSQVRETSRTRR